MEGNGSKMGRVLGAVVTVGGGALAGALDAKYPNNKPGGFTLGTVVGVGAAIAGIAKVGGKYSKHLMQVGEGALAYEAGRIAASRVSASTSSSAGVVGALGPRKRSISQTEFDRSMAMLRAA